MSVMIVKAFFDVRIKTMSTETVSEENILGVERDIIIKFLELIRDKYPSVDKANYFLERSGISGINIAIVNQRDALSHFCTLLVDSSLTPDEKLGQVYVAEEHLRRAVIESYQKALTLKLLSVQEFYEKYKNEVVPYQKSYQDLGSSPNINNIKDTLRNINTLGDKGRSVKSRNKWDDEWEEGINYYLEAFLEAEKLEDTLEHYLAIASQIPIGISKKLKILIGIVVVSVFLNMIFLITLLT